MNHLRLVNLNFTGEEIPIRFFGKRENYFSDIREEVEDIYMAWYFCEVAEYVTMENMDTREILKLLYQSLRALKVPFPFPGTGKTDLRV